MSETPTLSGAQNGRVRPTREVPGGVWIFEDDALVCRPAYLRVLRQRDILRCEDYARQYLAARGDKTVQSNAWQAVAALLWLHLALVEPPQGDAPLKPLWRLPDAVASTEGKVDAAQVALLPLWDLADGQLDRLMSEYSLLLTTQTPPALSHEQWRQIVEEGKKQSLATLVSRHGSSALIQVLHGTGGGVWRG